MSISLVRESDGEMLLSCPGRLNNDTSTELRGAPGRELYRILQMGVIVDDQAMGWAKGPPDPAAGPITPKNTFYSQRYRWNGHDEVWFLPKDMRDMLWQPNRRELVLEYIRRQQSGLSASRRDVVGDIEERDD